MQTKAVRETLLALALPCLEPLVGIKLLLFMNDLCLASHVYLLQHTLAGEVSCICVYAGKDFLMLCL